MATLSIWTRTPPPASAGERASRLVGNVGVGIAMGLVFLGIYLVGDLRDGTWAKVHRDSENLLGLMEEGVGRNIRMYDLSLQAAASLAVRPDVTGLEPALRRAVMFDQAIRAEGLGRMMITDAAGQVTFASDPDATRLPRFGDLPDFQRHRDDPKSGLVIAGPRISRLTGIPVMALSRRITNADGTFGGIAIGAIHLAYFQNLFGRLRIDEGGAVNLFHADGTLLVREPSLPGYPGRNVAGGDTFRRYLAMGRGAFVGRSNLDGKQRFYSFTRIEGLPLFVNVAIGVEAITAMWMPKAVIVTVLILGLSAVTIGIVWLLQREIARWSAAEASSRAANAELSLLASTDSLTGLPNRRRYDALLAQEWQAAARTGRPLALIVLDTDHFKHFNDHFGHSRGDEVLPAVADCLRRRLEGQAATACRIGGEEFAVIMPGLDADGARATAEAVRRMVAGLRIPHAPTVGGVATVSVGVAGLHPVADAGPGALFALADAALYEAKRAGRNRVRLAPGAPPPAAPMALSA